MTEASAYVYSLMNGEQKNQVIQTYFSSEEMNCHLVRIHMDSCDFCLNMYKAMSDPQDAELESFSFERTEKFFNLDKYYDKAIADLAEGKWKGSKY